MSRPSMFELNCPCDACGKLLANNYVCTSCLEAERARAEKAEKCRHCVSPYCAGCECVNEYVETLKARAELAEQKAGDMFEEATQRMLENNKLRARAEKVEADIRMYLEVEAKAEAQRDAYRLELEGDPDQPELGGGLRALCEMNRAAWEATQARAEKAEQERMGETGRWKLAREDADRLKGELHAARRAMDGMLVDLNAAEKAVGVLREALKFFMNRSDQDAWPMLTWEKTREFGEHALASTSQFAAPLIQPAKAEPYSSEGAEGLTDAPEAKEGEK